MRTRRTRIQPPFIKTLIALTVLATGELGMHSPTLASEIGKYFYRKSGKNIGPITREQLLEGVLEGVISGETYVWSKELKTWKRLKDTGILKNGRALASDSEPPPLKESEASNINRSYQRYDSRWYLRPFGGYHLSSAVNTGGGSSTGLFGFGAEIGFSTGESDIGIYYGRVSDSISLGGYKLGVTQQNILASFTSSAPGFFYGGRLGISIVTASITGGGYDLSESSPALFMTAPVLGVRIPVARNQTTLDLEVSAPGTLYEEVFDMAIVSVAAIRISF